MLLDLKLDLGRKCKISPFGDDKSLLSDYFSFILLINDLFEKINVSTQSNCLSKDDNSTQPFHRILARAPFYQLCLQ